MELSATYPDSGERFALFKDYSWDIFVRHYKNKLLCRSTDTLGGEVKFDIWEEADLEMEEGGLDNLEGRSDAVDAGLACDPAIRGLQEELDSAFPQHPLVVSSSAEAELFLDFPKYKCKL